jgi:hypothetical protein
LEIHELSVKDCQAQLAKKCRGKDLRRVSPLGGSAGADPHEPRQSAFTTAFVPTPLKKKTWRASGQRNLVYDLCRRIV